jgi:hypothetical protein
MRSRSARVTEQVRRVALPRSTETLPPVCGSVSTRPSVRNRTTSVTGLWDSLIAVRNRSLTGYIRCSSG